MLAAAHTCSMERGSQRQCTGERIQCNLPPCTHNAFGNIALCRPEVLPPLAHSYLETLSPDLGSLSYESDRQKIRQLMLELHPYIVGHVYEYGYAGEYSVSGKRHGIGTLLMKNGFSYKGDWGNDLCSGKGKIIWPNGNVYVGEVAGGRVTGKGTAFFANGVVQEGIWEDSVMNGVANVVYCSGLTFEGNIENGKIMGKGRSVLPTGSTFFSGQWNHGIPNTTGCNGCFYVSKFLCQMSCYFCRYSCCGCFSVYSPKKVQEHITWVSLGIGVANVFCCGIFTDRSTTVKKEGEEGEGYIVHALPSIYDAIYGSGVEASSNVEVWAVDQPKSLVCMELER